jgi:GT2 family glycosyltransferase
VVEHAARRASFCIRYIFEDRQGRSAALNTGIAAAQGEIIAFTDDDVLLHPEWLARVKDTFDRFDCAAVAGKIVPRWNHPKPRWLELEGQQAVVNFELGDEYKEIRFSPMGANSAFRKQVFDRHGLFRLDLGVCGSKHTITCDDTEFGQRLIKAGEKIIYSPNAIIYHPVDPERTTKRYFLTWYYYNGRSVTRTAGLPNQGSLYFGVPRWVYGGLLSNAVKWFFCLDATQRFRFRLRTYRSVGNFVESRQLSRLKGVNQSISMDTSIGTPNGLSPRSSKGKIRSRQFPGSGRPAV